MDVLKMSTALATRLGLVVGSTNEVSEDYCKVTLVANNFDQTPLYQASFTKRNGKWDCGGLTHHMTIAEINRLVSEI